MAILSRGVAYCGDIETMCAKCVGNQVVLRISGDIRRWGRPKVVMLGGVRKLWRF